MAHEIVPCVRNMLTGVVVVMMLHTALKRSWWSGGSSTAGEHDAQFGSWMPMKKRILVRTLEGFRWRVTCSEHLQRQHGIIYHVPWLATMRTEKLLTPHAFPSMR
jgi:hypothetical protein